MLGKDLNVAGMFTSISEAANCAANCLLWTLFGLRPYRYVGLLLRFEIGHHFKR